jgi:hypothetical protein
MGDVMIRVSDSVRDRLAAIAEARGTSIRSLVEELATTTLTPAELTERGARVHTALKQSFGVEIADADHAELQRRMDAALAQVAERQGRGAA